jgi:hypothetical protein
MVWGALFEAVLLPRNGLFISEEASRRTGLIKYSKRIISLAADLNCIVHDFYS